MTKITRKGSGRTKGSFSFTQVTLEQLTAKFTDPNQQITVGRKWAAAVGFTGLTSAPANHIANTIVGVTPATAVVATTSLLDE